MLLRVWTLSFYQRIRISTRNIIEGWSRQMIPPLDVAWNSLYLFTQACFITIQYLAREKRKVVLYWKRRPLGCFLCSFSFYWETYQWPLSSELVFQIPPVAFFPSTRETSPSSSSSSSSSSPFSFLPHSSSISNIGHSFVPTKIFPIFLFSSSSFFRKPA